MSEQRTLEDVRNDLLVDAKKYATLTSEHWNKMMFYASLKKLAVVRAELLGITQYLTDTYSAGTVKKHTKRLKGYFAELNRIENIDLNSKTYIKKVLEPLGALAKEIATFKKGSVTNQISETKITEIEVKAEEQSDALVAEVETELAKAA